MARPRSRVPRLNRHGSSSSSRASNPPLATTPDPLSTPASIARSNASGHSRPSTPQQVPSPFLIFGRRESWGSTFSAEAMASWDLEDRLRLWRHDALMHNMYETAAFWGNKVMTMTNDPSDVYWLAQTYFRMGQYARAQRVMAEVMDSSVACRVLAAQCSIRMEQYQKALDILGEENPFHPEIDARVINTEGGIKLEAMMCYLRGVAYLQLANLEQGKKCFQEAVELDVKCFEAFHALISNHMLTSSEEWNFVNCLDFEGQCGSSDAEFIKNNYVSLLKKHEHVKEIEEARSVLEQKYGLAKNTDVILSHAEQLYAQCRFKECLELTAKILDVDKYNQSCLPIHFVCLHELREKNKLFLLAHELVDYYPEMAVTWFGVGCYYYLIGQNEEARRYFSKASTIDSHYGPAWIGFGHSFALESEHDQAITAYSTAARLFQGSHLPVLFIGMQHLQASNLLAAEEYLLTSYQICKGDPLVLNELGVLYYNKQNYQIAVGHFEKALKIIEETKCRPQIWVTTWMNIGHAYRRMCEFDKAEMYYKKVIEISPPNAGALAALAYIYHVKEEYEKAITLYHEALGIMPIDSSAQDLLNNCLEEWIRHKQSLSNDTLQLLD
ncbi:8726_t:CDS:10 [Paraglomus occultum]|uniref:8726_t:CDS:1 n=1 Tax=Paraglomus occultum TaxID=144539 RepID=A0A9N9BD65_9GLOM|nr:8726_t:CDS:10 [Paraglomus occultum]